MKSKLDEIIDRYLYEGSDIINDEWRRKKRADVIRHLKNGLYVWHSVWSDGDERLHISKNQLTRDKIENGQVPGKSHHAKLISAEEIKKIEDFDPDE